ncbi:hypothetical protein XSR1_50100 [Xenorhabdus szentirmaii DSM 16338]|uniref:Uncharacterized protein n=1 Tax=Xenorhabdus szentirmaii DSM 16338 TaxID=1427518 RepID=W1J3Q4_9GAMM|nr:hypothetical protein XSR1_50100 [Xenorhabdus szentirmaii DSM 16338]
MGCRKDTDQAKLELNGNEISHYLVESVKSFRFMNEIQREYLYSEGIFSDSIVKIEIRLKPFISIECILLEKNSYNLY